MKNILKNKFVVIGLTLALGLTIGWFIKPSATQTSNTSEHENGEASNDQIWTCSMHPQIRKNEPGNCPICGMELIPLENTEDELDPMAVSMSSTAMQLAKVQTMVVGHNNAEKSIRLNGKIQADERLVFTQSSHIPGRVEKLSVNFTGEFVSQGQVIAYVYSPDLVTAQEELLEAQKIRGTQPALFNAAKEKLKNWKLTEKQIEQILASKKTMNQFPILANASGYVTKKTVNLGDYLKQGEAIYEIADLSKVWVLFEVYESDMTWIKKGATVSYTIQSLPGKNFKSTISFIDPVIDPKTRVAKARIEVANPGLLLKPEMFVSGTVESSINTKTPSITIPKTAVMWTGKRSVVYIMQNSAQGVSFLMRDVSLGPELGESYVIESGLQSGEEIAVNGTFSIDAAAQLAGKPSMMNPEGGVAMTGHNHGTSNEISQPSKKNIATSQASKNVLKPLLNSYFDLKTALSNDDLTQAKLAGAKMNKALANIDMNLFKGESNTIWMKQSGLLKPLVQHLEHMAALKEIRTKFIDISKILIAITDTFEPISETIYIQHCPMADSNKGADWLSKEKEIANPYFGSQMPTCGEIKRVIQRSTL